ncbi:hypothetical protein CJ177_43750 [Rhodococcus sp. ACPA1]|nr:hypothetical protein CJ177_43750 [Rhodococcus sp. ACPA1]
MHPDTAWGWGPACRSSAEWAGHGRDGGDCLVSDTVGRKSRARGHLWQPVAVWVVLGDSQAQPPPTMNISWQGRYTVNLHVVTSGA